MPLPALQSVNTIHHNLDVIRQSDLSSRQAKLELTVRWEYLVGRKGFQLGQ